MYHEILVNRIVRIYADGNVFDLLQKCTKFGSVLVDTFM